ncbi:MAG: hypothetical protein ACK5N8_08455 [Alphaproteobacteria bacterium]
MKKKLVALSVLSLLVGTSTAFAQDDVLIDLSVLNSVQNNSVAGNVVQPKAQKAAVETVTVSNGSGKSVSTILNLPPLEPKFPVVKAQPKKKVVAKPVKKKQVKKAEKKSENPFTEAQIAECQKILSEKEQAAKTVVSTPVTSVVNVQDEPTTSTVAEKVAASYEDKSDTSDVDRIIKEFEDNKKVEESSINTVLEEKAPEVVSLPTEEVLPQEVKEELNITPVESVVEAEAIVEEKATETVAEVQENIKVEADKIEVEEILPVEIPVEAVVEEKVSEVASDVEAKTVAEPKNLINIQEKAPQADVTQVENKTTDLLVPVVSEVPASPAVADVSPVVADTENYMPNIIKFDEGITSLTEVDKFRINSIISKFEDVRAHKIGIVAYNLDNGQDTFKRKRESLSRATEIRSYLLSQGYKEFKIKVVNVDETSNKINMIELVEMK